MRKILIFIFALVATSALAQVGPQGGPSPQPDPWVISGDGIYYNGCAMVPYGVTGGCKGAGTINATAIYVGGVIVPTSSSGSFAATYPISVTFPSNVATYALNYDSNFATVSNALAFASVPTTYLLANCGSTTAEPIGCSWTNFADQAIGTTQGIVPYRNLGQWGSLLLGNLATQNAGTGLANSGTNLNLQPAQASTIGGVESIASLSHNWISYIDTSGIPHQSQPAASDLSNGTTGSGAVVLSTSPLLTTPQIAGSSTGYTTIASANAGATNYTLTAPAVTDTLATLGNITAALPSATTSQIYGGSGTAGIAAVLSTLPGAAFPALTGDVTTTAGSLATTLAAVNTNIGSFGSATQAPQITVNAKGLTTAASNVTITPAIGSVTGLGPGVGTAVVLGVNTAGGLMTSPAANANLAQANAATLKGNPTGSLANVSDFTIQGLINDASPSPTLDYIPLYDHVTGTIKNVTPSAIAGAVGSVSSVSNSDGTLNISPTTGAVVASLNPAILPNYLGGLVLSNDATTPNSVLDIEGGSATDSTNTYFIKIGAFTKSTAGAWAAGSGSNGMGNGLTIAASTWYAVCLAYNAGSPDIWFDTSNTCANKPTGISGAYYRRIGYFKTNTSSGIYGFSQSGDNFTWAVMPSTPDINVSTLGTTPTLFALASVPPGKNIWARLRATMYGSGPGSGLIYAPLQGALAANIPAGNVNLIWNTASYTQGADLTIQTDAAANVEAVSNHTSIAFQANVYGWIDHRGRLN